MNRQFGTASIATWRARPHRAIWYLAVHKPASLFYAPILSTPESYPTSALDINHVGNDGVLGDAKKNMTVRLGSLPGGSEEGIIRLRENMGNASTMSIAETGSGVNRYYTGTYVTVMDERRPVAKHPRFNLVGTSQWEMDYNEVYGDELDSPGYGPLVIMGPPVAGFLDGGTMTASFVGTSSVFIDSTQSTQAWAFPHGQLSLNLGAEHAPVGETFSTASPNGRYFSLTLVDADGKTQASHRLIWAFADRTGPAKVSFANISGGVREGGFKANVTAYAGANTDEFPDGAEVLIFEEASYAGVASSLGGNYPFRENIVMRGWINQNSVTFNPFSGQVTFDMTTIDGVLGKAISYDAFHAYVNTTVGASEWVEAEQLSVDRAMIDLIKHRSTVAEITDVHLASGVAMTTLINFQDLPQSNLWSQMRLNYGEKGTRGLVAADMQSSIFCREDIQISGGSVGKPVEVIRYEDRMNQISWTSPHFDPNARTRMYGVATIPGGSEWRGENTSIIPMGGESPGDVFDYYGGTIEHARGLVIDTQDTIITWSGNWRAMLNSRYSEVTVPLAGYLRYDPVPQSRIQFSLSGVDNPRGVSWSNKEFLTKSINIEYGQQTAQTTISMEETVNGKGGSAITFPRPDDFLFPLPNFPPPPPPVPQIPGPQSGKGDIWAYSSEAGAYRFITDWTANNDGLTGASIKDLHAGFNEFTSVRYRTQAGRIYRKTLNGLWADDTPSSDPPGGTAGAVEYIWHEEGGVNQRHDYFLGRQNVSGTWASWVLRRDRLTAAHTWGQITALGGAGSRPESFGASSIFHQDVNMDFVQNRRLMVAEMSDGKAFLTYYDPIDTHMNGVAILVNGTSLNGGVNQDILPAIETNDHSAFGLEPTRAVVGVRVLRGTAPDRDFMLETILIQSNASGNSYTFGSPFAVDPGDPAVGGTGPFTIVPMTANRFMAIYNSPDGNNQARYVDNSGINNQTMRTVYDFEPSLNGMGDYAGAALTDDRVLFAYNRFTASAASGTVQIADANGTCIAFSGPFVFDDTPRVAIYQVQPLGTASAIILYRDYPTDTMRLIVAEVDSGGSVTFGTPVSYVTGASAPGQSDTISKLSDTVLVVTQAMSTWGIHHWPISISGNTITVGTRFKKDEETADLGSFSYANTVAAGSRNIVTVWNHGTGLSQAAYYTTVMESGDAGGEVKAYGLTKSKNGDKVYVTYSDNTNLNWWAGTATSLIGVRNVSLGAGTIAEADVKTVIAYPVGEEYNNIGHGPDIEAATVYGRMRGIPGLANPTHVASTENGGTSWRTVENGWGADHAGAMEYGVGSGDNSIIRNSTLGLGILYRGRGSLLQKGIFGSNVNPGALLDSRDGFLVVGASGNPATNRIAYTSSPYMLWSDLTRLFPSDANQTVTAITL